MRRNFLIIAICTVLMTLAFSSTSATAATGKITITPNPASLSNYQIYQAEFKLTQPIICPQLPNDVVCKVVLDLSVNNDPRVQINQTSLTWLSNESAQSRFVTVTALPDGVHNYGEDTVVLHGISGAYSGDDPDVIPVTTAPFYYTLDAENTITLEDSDPLPTTTTTTTIAVPSPLISSPANTAPGKTITVSGSNFKADSDVSITLHSTPVTLGTFKTNSSGVFRAQVTIPKNTITGSHQIVVAGINAAGESVSRSSALSVGSLPETGGNLIANTVFALLTIACGIALVQIKRRISF